MSNARKKKSMYTNRTCLRDSSDSNWGHELAPKISSSSRILSWRCDALSRKILRAAASFLKNVLDRSKGTEPSPLITHCPASRASAERTRHDHMHECVCKSSRSNSLFLRLTLCSHATVVRAGAETKDRSKREFLSMNWSVINFCLSERPCANWITCSPWNTVPVKGLWNQVIVTSERATWRRTAITTRVDATTTG
jgi:hypothetical protein